MDNIEFKKLLLTENNNGFKSRKKYIENNYNEEYCKIIQHNSTYFNSKYELWNQMLYNYLNNIFSEPKCNSKNCNNNIKFYNGLGYPNKYCSVKCAQNSNEVRNLVKKNNLRKYGTEEFMSTKCMREKTKKTNLLKYGVEFSSQSNIVKEKRKKTNLLKYGVENISQSNIVKNEKKKTNLLKYGVENPLQSSKIQEKTKKTNLLKYGVENPLQLETVKEKRKKTNLFKYGVKNLSQSPIIREKINKTLHQKKIINFSKLIKVSIKDISVTKKIYTINKCCTIHDSFKISEANLYNRTKNHIENICTKCNPISENSSIKENDVRDFIINKLNIKTEKFKINNNEIDIYISSHNLGIEFDGLYWHSNIYKDENYHSNKTELCKNNNIELIHIFEDEWVNKKEIVKNNIKFKLGLIENHVNYQDCFLKEINIKTFKYFILDNNMHDIEIRNDELFGLYQNNKLIHVISICKNDDFYEITSCCSKLNFQIHNLNEFFKHYNEKSKLIFKIDGKYNLNYYPNELKMRLIEISKPNRWFFLSNKLIRFKKISNIKKYYTIYDCGYLTYVRDFF